jgi:hypothetical protein
MTRLRTTAPRAERPGSKLNLVLLEQKYQTVFVVHIVSR